MAGSASGQSPQKGESTPLKYRWQALKNAAKSEVAALIASRWDKIETAVHVG